jgi:DNA-binding CsgD family transcriptional regulator
VHVTDVDLRERSLELDELTGGLGEAAAGHGVLIVLEGAAGLGKTTLIAAARRHAAERGLRTLSARASQLEHDFPFGVVRQLLEPVLYAADEAQRERWFAGAAAMARALFDSLASGHDEEERFRRRHGLYWLVANLAQDSPLLLCVDDAQWADEPSLGFVRHLATRLETLPVLLLVASRADADGVRPLLVEPTARVLRPAPLSPGAVGSWVGEEVGGDDEFAAACHRATAGNPFLVREVLREVRAARIEPDATGVARLERLSPRTVASSILLRLGGLPPAAGELARAAAVLGETELSAVADLAGLERVQAVAAVAALTRAGILEGADPPRFAHPVVRTVLYEDTPAATRAAMHADAARRLHAAGAKAHQVAAHLVLAPPVDERWAYESLRAAAAEAGAGGAPEVAARFLQRALPAAGDDAERFQLQLALGRAEALAGRSTATGHFRAAVRLAREPAEHARATIRLARVLRFTGRGGEAVERLRDAHSRLGAGDAAMSRAIEQELLAAATVSYAARQAVAADAARWRAAARRPPQTEFDQLVLAADAVEAAAAGRPVPEVLALVDAAAGRPLADDDLGRHIGLLLMYADLLIGRLDRVDAALEALQTAAVREGGGAMLAMASAQRALVHMHRGHVEAAETDAGDALEIAADLPAPPAFLLTGAAALLWVSVECGEPAHAAAVAMRDDDSLFGRHLNHAQARLRVAEGGLERGVEELLAAGRREEAIGWRGPAQFPWRSDAALALAELGDRPRALALAEEELGLAQGMGAPRPLGIALRAHALLCEGEERRRGLAAAAEVLDGSGADLEHGRALTDLGAELRRSGRAVDSREPLRRGYELAARCGATLLAERARQELLAAGTRPRRAMLNGREALTPSELRVAELAAQDLRNRDIAQRLFITEKTVETHLGHVYAKLGLRSRRDLARALA